MAGDRATRILVVENDDESRRSICTILAAAGFELVDASDRKEAIDALGRSPAVDIVMLDLDMPQFDSIDILDSIANGPAVIMLSAAGSRFSEGIKERYSKEAVSILPKPVEASDLLAAVQSALRSRPWGAVLS